MPVCNYLIYLQEQWQWLSIQALGCVQQYTLPALRSSCTHCLVHPYALQVYDRYGKSTLSSPQYQAWFEENAFWLRPYAAFCLLRDIFGVRRQQDT